VLDRVHARPARNIWFKWSAVGVTVLVVATLLSANMLRIQNDSPVVTTDTAVVAKNLVNEADKVAIPAGKLHVKIEGNPLRIKTTRFYKTHKKQIGGINKNFHVIPAQQVKKINRIPSARYFVVMTPIIDPEVPVYSGNSMLDENQVDSSYSIQVEDKDAATVTNLSVTNEITPEMQPKNTVEYSITNTAPPVETVEPERSFNYEDNRSINCLDTVDGIG
jgi:hypothetical protein